MENFWKAFISLFVAIDVAGALPLFAGMTKGMAPQARLRLVHKSVLAAAGVGIIFIFGGRAIFQFLGILENDFRIAGGILLLVFAIRDLTSSEIHQGSTVPLSVGIVPVAIPLIMGPAALASVMLATEEFGVFFAIASLILNIVITWILFCKVDVILNWIGSDFADALAKIFSLLLAAIGVMLIRLGLSAYWH